jgi:hypothetical protein
MLLADDDGEAVRSVGGVGVGFACAVVGGMGPHPWPISCGSPLQVSIFEEKDRVGERHPEQGRLWILDEVVTQVPDSQHLHCKVTMQLLVKT